MANQAAARHSPSEPSNLASSPISNISHPIHNSAASSYYHHYHHSVASSTNQNPAANAGYSPPQNVNHSGSLNGNESPNSVDQFTSNSNNIQLPETPNSLVTTIMGPTSGNSNSNEGANAINEASPSESAAIISNNNNYSPWCTSAGHHQNQLSNSSPIHSSSYSTAHHPSASLYSAHHNLSSTLIPHQNISGFAHPHGGKSFPQPFYSTWY